MKRRELLKGLPTAALFSTAVIASTADASVAADLAGQDAFDAALANYDAAFAEKQEAIARFNAIAPRRIAALDAHNSRQLANGYRAVGCIAERDQDAEGNDVWLDTRARYTARSWLIFEELGYIDGRTSDARHLKFLRAMAQHYEAGLARARSESGIAAAIERMHFADGRLSSALHALCRETATSPSHVVCKAIARIAALKREPSLVNAYLDKGIIEDVVAVFGGVA